MSRGRRTASLAVLIVSVVASGACASSATAPDSATAGGDVKSRDTIECMNQAREVRATPQGARPVVNQDRYQQCMKERGHFTTR
jgi:hypothetical protein